MKRILILFIIIAGAYILYNSIGNLPWLSGKDSNGVEVTDKVDTIEFDISSVSMTIIPEDRKDLETVYEGKGKVTVKRSGDTITVEHKRPWFLLFSFFNSTKLTVYVPEDYNQDMLIDVGSGNVELAGKSSSQPFELKELSLNIGSGNVELENIVVKNFSHDGGSGNLTVNSLESETSSIDLSSGNAKLSDFTGKLEADIFSGKLNVQMSELKDSVDIDVSSGNVVLDLPDNADFKLNGEVGSGNISYDYPLSISHDSKHEIEGTHGSGKHSIELEVSSGNVEVK